MALMVFDHQSVVVEQMRIQGEVSIYKREPDALGQRKPLRANLCDFKCRCVKMQEALGLLFSHPQRADKGRMAANREGKRFACRVSDPPEHTQRVAFQR